MEPQKKIIKKIGKNKPNASLWKKPITYYKEHCSYLAAFKDAVKRSKEQEQDKKE